MLRKTSPVQRRWGRRTSSCHGLDQSSPNTRHQIVGLHARLDLDSLPVTGLYERVPGDPVEPTATKYTRPHEAP